MKKALKWVGIVLGGLLGLLILAVIAVYVLSNSRINKSYTIQVESVAIPDDEAALERGQHIAITRGCADCHGKDLGGFVFIDDPALGLYYGTNLTPSGVAADYSDEDWIRALRHGVGPNNKPLLFMPSFEYYYFSDQDIGDLIAYLKTIPAVDKQPKETSVGLLGRVLFLGDQFPLLPAEVIDHTAPRPIAPPPGVTVEYGEYMAVGCTGCHGLNLAGGPIPGGDPSWPPAANLTPAGNLSNWTEEDFINTLRTGVTPEGLELGATYMPWPNMAQMTDDELQAMWLYIQSLPAIEQ